MPLYRHARLPALHWWRFLTRSPCFVAGPEDHILTLSRQRLRSAFHPIESQPSKAAPSSGADGDRASWDGGTTPVCRRRHPRSAD